jgi:PAS domain S-box-containing protein
MAAVAGVGLGYLGTRLPRPWSPGPEAIPVRLLSLLLTTGLWLAILLTTRKGPGPRALWGARGLAALVVLVSLAVAWNPMGAFSLERERALISVSALAIPAFLGGALGFLLLTAGASRPGWVGQVGSLVALVPPLAGLLVILSHGAGAPFLYNPQVAPMSLPTALGLVSLGVGLQALGSGQHFPMSLFLLGAGDGEGAADGKGGPLLGAPLAFFLVLGLMTLAGGCVVLRIQVTHARRAACARLSAIADLKTRLVAQWVRERLRDTRGASSEGFLGDQVQRCLGAGPSAAAEREVRGWMRSLLAEEAFQSITLLDARGAVRFQEGEAPAPDPGPALFQELRRGRNLRLVEPRMGTGGQVDLGIWVPVNGAPGPAPGLLFFRMDVRRYLFPFLDFWPGLSPSAETVLAMARGGAILCLSPTRHRPGPGLGLRLLPGGQDRALERALAREDPEPFPFLDYRGVPVLGTVRRVPQTGWILVVKEDQGEVLGELRSTFWTTAAGVFAAILLLAFGIGLLIRRYGHRRMLERLAQERERKALARRGEELMSQATDGILVLDLDGRVLEANEKARSLFGMTQEELRTRNVRSLGWTAEEGDGDPWDRLQGEGSVWEMARRDSGGIHLQVEVSARVVTLGEAPAILAFLRDITERRAQAREIHRLSHLYAALSHVSQAVAWARDPEGLFGRVCEVLVGEGEFQRAWIALEYPQKGEQRLLASREREGQRSPFPLDQDPAERAAREGRTWVLNRLEGHGSVAAFPIRAWGEGSLTLTVQAREAGFFGKDEVALLEETAREMALALDHLEEEALRVKAEQELRAAKAFTEDLIQAASVMVVGVDRRGDTIIFNDAAQSLTGYRREELLGRDWFEILIPWARFPHVRAEFRQLMKDGAPRNFESPILTRDGEERYIRWQSTEIRSGEEATGAIFFGMDLTQERRHQEEQRKLQAQLQQSQKMESLGSLAGGVAHDLNNVLGAILSLASTQREDPDLPQRALRSLETIQNACLRGRDVIKSLLYFARKDLDAVHSIDLNILVKDMVQLLAYTTLKRVNLEMDLQENLGTLLGDGGALSHALMNLCVNAVDAMPGGGTLRLRTRRLPGGGLQLSVKDTGTGMSPETLEKAMEPFFTTKPMGKGTGLGLSMVFGTMKAHGGTLELRSILGEGTEAILIFPGVSQPALEESRPAEPPRERKEGRGSGLSILLVDDDELIRASVGPMLELLGHKVHLAEGGQAALDLLEAGLEVDLVILDMNMPGLNGAETLARLLARRPHQTVLLASGYSDQDITQLMDGRPRVHSLRKPFSIHELKETLANLP